jgi:predicted ArsR family transcriptional regulator
MNDKKPDLAAIFRRKFEVFQQLSTEGDEEFVREKMLEGYPERQKKRMGLFIDRAPLAAGFREAIPLFRQMGMDMDVVDVSTPSTDAALEIQRTCPVLDMCAEFGLARPCSVICEIDVEATRRAFPGMEGEILCTRADGACVCVFKYERKRWAT